jgi:SAM-dependent methyltransferase
MPRAPRKAPLSVQVAAVVPLSRTEAFSVTVEELREALGRLGVEFSPGAKGGVTERGTKVGEVEAWVPRERVRLAWHPAPWKPDEATTVELRFEDVPGGTKVTVEHRGGEPVFGEGNEAAGWVVGGAFAPFLKSLTPSALGDWVTDRAARRPSGRRARDVYSDPVYHRPNFALLLEALELGPKDRLLEVGCGGGAFLHEALQSGCRATAVDHSPEMVRLAREANREAVDAGRLEVIEAEASQLPVPGDTFTCAVSTGVLGFLPHPLETLQEVHRALVMGGRFALFSGTRELVGTPGCPEPIAARVRFYEDDELEQLARSAGFRDAEVRRPDLTRYAVALGLPDEVVAAFRGNSRGGQLLLGHKARL